MCEDCPVNENGVCSAVQESGDWICSACGRFLSEAEVDDIEAFLESAGPDLLIESHLKHTEDIPTSLDIHRAMKGALL